MVEARSLNLERAKLIQTFESSQQSGVSRANLEFNAEGLDAEDSKS